MRLPLAVTAALLALVAAPVVAAGSRLAPLPRAEALVVHGPYEQGACDTCHERNNPRDPGAAKVTRESCLSCHDEFDGKAPVRLTKSKSHPGDKAECTSCHNPHNSKKKRLLL